MTVDDSTGRASTNSLSVRFPLLAAEWHPTLNGDRVPSVLTPGSKLKAHWLCPVCSHVWQARVSSRTHGHGCPACARKETGRLKSLPRPGDSLAERFPKVAAEWHPSKNGDLAPETVGYASNKKVWWLCARCGHEWHIQVANRTSGSSCRNCAHAALRQPKPGASLAERHPTVAAEWHPTLNGDLTPSEVAFSAKRKASWKCAGCGNEWEASVGNRARGAGCPGCCRRGKGRKGNPRPAKDAGVRSNSAPKASRSTLSPLPRMPEPSSVDHEVPPGTSLTERYPEVAAQWHPTQNGDLKPAGFRWASNARVWWLCPTCGHEWSAMIISRTRGGAGCPQCGRRRAGATLGTPKPGQSLAERLPELAAQWHPTLNGDLNPAIVTAKSGKRAWWLCPTCGNEWEAQIGSRATGSGCKSCATRQIAVAHAKPCPGQSLAEQDPELAGQWHPTRNGDLTPHDVTGNSGKKAWWLCARGHEWQAMINNRTKARGCPRCILWGTSAEEIRLRHELLAAGVPIEVERAVITPRRAGRSTATWLCLHGTSLSSSTATDFTRPPTVTRRTVGRLRPWKTPVGQSFVYAKTSNPSAAVMSSSQSSLPKLNAPKPSSSNSTNWATAPYTTLSTSVPTNLGPRRPPRQRSDYLVPAHWHLNCRTWLHSGTRSRMRH